MTVTMTLSPYATEFVPSPTTSDDEQERPGDWDEMMDDDGLDYQPPMASAADYEELRSVDAWLNLLVDLEELEHEHLINLAVSLADPATLERIHQRTNAMMSISETDDQLGTIDE